VHISQFFRRLLIVNLIGAAALFIVVGGYVWYLYASLPQMITVADYKPLLSSDIYARGGEKIGEFYSSKQGVRFLTPYNEIPKNLINAFVSAEDGTFFTHSGFNVYAIGRAVWTNVISGQKRQGASTITQQTARTLFLTSEKTYSRKLKEALLTYKMEEHLKKEEILYLYLNQIYLGQGAYGVAAAAETYFRKPLDKLSLAECAMLAGLPTSPSHLNPVLSPKNAKSRQIYTLNRMVEEGYITKEEANKAINETLKVQTRKAYKDIGPYYVETVRQMLVKQLGEDAVLTQGLKIYTSLDLKAQVKALESVQAGVRHIDKKRGYRGPKATLDPNDTAAIDKVLKESRDKLIKEKFTLMDLRPDGSTFTFVPFEEQKKSSREPLNLPPYVKVGDIVDGVVTRVDDQAGLVYVRFTESQGVIALSNMLWARPFNPDLVAADWLNLKKPSQALKPGMVIDVKILGNTYTAPSSGKGKNKVAGATLRDYANLALEEEPDVQGALLSYDLETSDIVAMVGGLDYVKYKFNRTYQAVRQTGSSFKPIVYAAGLEKGLTVATPIMGAPIVYGAKTDEEKEKEAANKKKNLTADDVEESPEAWKPENYDGKFTGDVLLRNALKRSLNTPTIRVLEKATIPFAAEYARRLGITSELNMDMSLALGSSGVTLYEMNKVISTFVDGGKKFTPILVREVQNRNGEPIAKNISLDQHPRFEEKLAAIDQEFVSKREEYKQAVENYKRRMASKPAAAEGDDDSPVEKPPVNAFFFDDPNQLISPQTAYLVTNMLQGVAMEADGTGGRAGAEMQRPVAGKTGTTNGYYDAWFLGATPQYATSVWVGLDTEKTLGKGETGGNAALPIWAPYMVAMHEGLPVKEFAIPDNIVFVAVDKETGRPSPDGQRLPFIKGTEPGSAPKTSDEKQIEEKNFLRESF